MVAGLSTVSVDRRLLVEVIGRHELGCIPEAHARAVELLGRGRRLGLVAEYLGAEADVAC